MYNLVLLMVLGAGGDAPAWSDASAARPLDQSRQLQRHRCGGCFGGGGCYGYVSGCCGRGISYGCYGGGMVYTGCCGGMYRPVGCYGPYPGGLMRGPEAAPKPKPSDGTKPPEEVRGPEPAVIVVSLPADARLTVDDTPTRSTSSVRTLISPPLQPGKAFTYTLKAEINRGNGPITETREVTVRAGEQANVRFDFPAASVAQR
jgi:uncharacterized protein (TIGR03000 family)